MNVLITSASRKVSLVRAFQQALAKEGGGKVIALDANPLSPALYLADDHYLVPSGDSPEYLTVMLRLCKQLSIRLLIPTRDEELPFFAGHKVDFTAEGVAVMVADPEVVAVCQDKKRFITFCHENGFPTPRSYFPEDLPAELNFPLFIKPRFGKGGGSIAQVGSREELAMMLEEAPEVIVQEFMRAPEYTIDLFADFTGQVISVVPRQRIRIVAGESFVGRTAKSPPLIQEAVRLATRLRLIGHNTIQCFLDQGEVKFIEVNPRFGGAAHLGFAAGAPTPLFLIRLLKGERLEPRIGNFKDDYVMLRYTEDLFLDADSISHGMFR